MAETASKLGVRGPCWAIGARPQRPKKWLRAVDRRPRGLSQRGASLLQRAAALVARRHLQASAGHRGGRRGDLATAALRPKGSTDIRGTALRSRLTGPRTIDSAETPVCSGWRPTWRTSAPRPWLRGTACELLVSSHPSPIGLLWYATPRVPELSGGGGGVRGGASGGRGAMGGRGHGGHGAGRRRYGDDGGT